MESVIRVPNIANSSKQGMEELDASMPDFADLLRMEPRIPSQMRNLLAPSVLPSPPLMHSSLQASYLSPVTSPEDIYIGEPEEPVPTICETQTSVSSSLASTPLTNVTNSQTSTATLTNGTSSQTSAPLSPVV